MWVKKIETIENDKPIIINLFLISREAQQLFVWARENKRGSRTDTIPPHSTKDNSWEGLYTLTNVLLKQKNAVSLFLIDFNKLLERKKERKKRQIFTGSVALSSVDPMAGTFQCPLRTVARTGRLVTGVASRPDDRWLRHTRLLLLLLNVRVDVQLLHFQLNLFLV